MSSYPIQLDDPADYTPPSPLTHVPSAAAAAHQELYLALPSSFTPRSDSSTTTPVQYSDRDQDRADEDGLDEDGDEEEFAARQPGTGGVTDGASVMDRARPNKATRRSSFYRAPDQLQQQHLQQQSESSSNFRVGNEDDRHGLPGQDLRAGTEADYDTSPQSGTSGRMGRGMVEPGQAGSGPSRSQPQYSYQQQPRVDTLRDKPALYGIDTSVADSPRGGRQPQSGNGNGASSESGSYSSHEPWRYQPSAQLQPAYTYQPQSSTSRAESVYNSTDPQQPAALLDQSHLHPGNLASLLSHEKTLDLYRANAKKTGDPDVQFEFCTFVMEVVGELELASRDKEIGKEGKEKTQALVAESVALLAKLANRGHMKSQYFLADCYTQGVGTVKGKRDYDKAYPLFVLAGKHGHPDACFRAAQCCENGWGCRKDFPRAVTFLRKSAMLAHPPAMHRLGLAEMNGELALAKRPKEGLKWIKRAAELADQVDPPQPQSLHELAMLNEKGIDNVIFVDHEYAAELYARAAELGYSPSAYKLGECYEYGKMGCPQDSALSIHYYNIAAQQNHREACFALTAWYLVGSPGVLPQSDTEAYLWARKAAEMGLAKAEYAVGYFTEVGIGTHKHARDALEWFRKAADHGDKRAKERLRMASFPPPPLNSQTPHQTNSLDRRGKEPDRRDDRQVQSMSSRGNLQQQQQHPLPRTPEAFAPLPLDDPYGHFYAAPIDNYGRPSPVERPLQGANNSSQNQNQTQRQAQGQGQHQGQESAPVPMSNGDETRGDQVPTDGVKRGVLTKPGGKKEKSEDCVIC